MGVPAAARGRHPHLMQIVRSVNHLQCELDHARREGAGDETASAYGRGTLRAGDRRRKVQIRVIEDVVKFRTELDL